MKTALTTQEKLKDLRTDKQLTLEQLAEKTGSSVNSYHTRTFPALWLIWKFTLMVLPACQFKL